MALLFDGTMGIFSGWMRALAGSALASLAAIIVTAAHLLAVESELAHLQSIRLGGAARMLDPQALTTIVFIFSLAMLVTSFAAMRMASAFRLRGFSQLTILGVDRPSEQRSTSTVVLHAAENTVAMRGQSNDQSRAAGVAEALALTIRREAAAAVGGQTIPLAARDSLDAGRPPGSEGVRQGLGTTSRRLVSRRTRSAARRDSADR
jgi:type IV secretion system protein VirB6